MTETIYGFTKFSECYHRNPNCPVLNHMKKQQFIEIISYKSEEDASARGHIRRCKQCMGDVVFADDIQEKVRLTKKQFETLNIIVSINKETGTPMNLKQISVKRGKSVVATHLIVKSLMKQQLVEKRYGTGSRKAKNKSIQPTTLGISLTESPPEA